MLYSKIIPIEGLDMQVVKSDVSLMFSRDADNNKTVTLGKFLGRESFASSFKGSFSLSVCNKGIVNCSAIRA